MSERAESEGPAVQPERAVGWGEHLGRVLRAATALLATRRAIFREELAEKAAFLWRALGLLAAALAFGLLALLLATALVAALFTRLLGGPFAGILATLLLYAAAGGAGLLAARRLLSRVRPLDFPITREEFLKDWEGLEPAEAEEGEASSELSQASRSSEVEDLEERFRAGSE